ncbi:tellurite resistance TerB family protein [Lichenibacterium dinghuense]|uniref:tellurite resistance TerB family protein n=1 Tax=Lichenibacterium dinghuense TaxID=2895977 RepID=UPI001F2B1DB2|nr:TerB family tellurite resistance protein [Lichenibacterium sp. 6Y81]
MVYRSPRPPSDLAADAAEFREPAFRDALVAGVAMVSHADGAPSPAERSRFLSLLEEDPALATFDRAAVLDDLAVHEGNYRFDVEVGTLMARDKLVRIAGRTRLCAALVRICRAVIPADGVIHPAEHRALAEIRSVLGVTARPVVFGAYGASAYVAAPVRQTAAE